MKLEEIIAKFDDLVERYEVSPWLDAGPQAQKDILLKFSDEFTNLYKAIGTVCARLYGYRTQHDDKSATAFKARIARDEFDKMTKKSWNRAIELAAGSKDYQDFLQSRIFYYESWDSVSHLRDVIKQYIINLGQRLSHN